MIILISFFVNHWCYFRVCGLIIICFFCKGKFALVGESREPSIRRVYSLNTTSDPPTAKKLNEDWFSSVNITWRNISSKSAETAYLGCRKCHFINIRFSGRFGPTNRAWFKDLPWNLAAPLRTQRTLPGTFGIVTGWCGWNHSRSALARARGSCG